MCVCLQRFYKKAAAFVLRAVAKHSPELSQSVVACGGVDALVLCLEEFDPGVKEAAAWALGYIARHNACKEDALTSSDFLRFPDFSLPFSHIFLKGQFLLPVVLFISLNCFGVSCLVLEISAVEISAFSLI